MLAVVGITCGCRISCTEADAQIGIRLALGATGQDILRLVVGNGARLIGAGIVIGIVASFALQRLCRRCCLA
jgi:putative ABC transport system permease protein